jgi:hypothetical protein
VPAPVVKPAEVKPVEKPAEMPAPVKPAEKPAVKAPPVAPAVPPAVKPAPANEKPVAPPAPVPPPKPVEVKPAAPAAPTPVPASEKKPADKKAPVKPDEKDPFGSNSQPMRHWTDNTGQYHIEGRFVARLNDGTIRLIGADGCYVRVSFARLSPADQGFVLNQRRSIAMD